MNTVNDGQDDHGEEDDETDAGETAKNDKEDVFHLQNCLMQILQ